MVAGTAGTPMVLALMFRRERTEMAVYLSLTTRWRSRQASLSATEGWSSCRIRIWPRYSRLAILADLKAEEVADAPRNRLDEPRDVGAGRATAPGSRGGDQTG